MNWCATSLTFKSHYCTTVEELLSYWFFKYRGNMIIFPCVANDTGRKILHSLDATQVM